MKLGVVTGLLREAQCLPQPVDEQYMSLRCAGASSRRAEGLARELLKEGCGALVSFGIAGALSPDLRSGQVILADKVVGADGSVFQTSSNWRERLLCALPRNGGVVSGSLFGSESVIALPEEKARLHAEHGALAVDMESHRVVDVANQANVPVLAVRAVADLSGQHVPQSALGVIDVDGRPRISKVLGKLISRPADLPHLLRLSKSTETALASLRRTALAAGVLFNFA